MPAPIFGSFLINGDYWINTTYRREISLSFNPATLKCGCADATPFLQRRDNPQPGAQKGRVIVLSDHCFTPTVADSDHANGECLAIVRAEHGDFFELADLFFRLANITRFRGAVLTCCPPFLIWPMQGPADMADVIGRIKTRLSGTVEAFPIAPLLLGGCEDQSLTRAVFDVCLWLKAIPGYPFIGYTNAVIASILAEGTGGPQPAYRAHHHLPLDLEFATLKNVLSSGHPGLSKLIRPFGETRENPAVSMLLCEISTSFDMPICLNPSFERLPTVRDQGDPHVLVVGVSHAARLAEQIFCGLRTSVLAGGGQAGQARPWLPRSVTNCQAALTLI
jgi:hypothetical protein